MHFMGQLAGVKSADFYLAGFACETSTGGFQPDGMAVLGQMERWE